MKVSIITPVHNDPRVSDTIESVARQSYCNVEHIIVDAMSTAPTASAIQQAVNDHCVIIRESDSGMYDAINKGIRKASGDVIGILNADDYFAHDDALSRIVYSFQHERTAIIYGDVRYVDERGSIIRGWISGGYYIGKFQRSWSPAHPTFYVRRAEYQRLGLYKTDYLIAADVELMYRFLEVHKLSWHYIPEVLVTMRAGGVSNRGLRSTLTIYKEVRKGIRDNGGHFFGPQYLFYKLLKARQLFLK